MIGEIVSHYRILEKLGAGGMGEVYKAEDTRLNRLVALKMLLAGGAQSETARQRFLREAQAASALNHPNIATIYEIDEVERDGVRYSFIAMEYVPGATLRDLRGQLALKELLDIFTQIADALSEAHKRGIVHRDVKPSNILVGESRRAKLLDFGVAKFNPLAQAGSSDDSTASLYETNLFKTAPGTVLGTFAYLSPEQALGEEVDARSDVFSLGAVFYEMLANRPPFTGSSALAVVDAILHATPAPVGAFNREVVPALENLVHRMLAKDRALRCQSLNEVLRELAALGDCSTQMLPGDTLRSDSYATQSLASDLLNSAAIKARAGKSVAVLRFHNITGSPQDEWIGVGIAETVTADLKNIEGISVIGRELVYEVLRRWNAEQRLDFDEQFATRVGREVGARWIVGGGYQRLGEMLRITARFVEVETAELIKTVKIDGRMEQIFELQDKIVFELSRNLELGLRSGERAGIAEQETSVIAAYEAYVKGKALAYAAASDSFDEGIASFERAIALDPQYAQAYAGLSYALALKGQAMTLPHLVERAVEYAQKAIALRPNLPDSYSALGLAFTALNRADDAIGALKRALAFAPNDPLLHSSLGRAYFVGKAMFPEAAAEFELAKAVPSDNAWVVLALAQVYAFLGQLERAEQVARGAVQIQEEHRRENTGLQMLGAYMRLGNVLYRQGRYDEALAELEREIEFCRSSTHMLKERTLIQAWQKRAAAHLRKGDHEQALAAFDAMMQGFQARLQRGADDPFTRYYVACGCAMMGETEEALEHLRVAVDGRPEFNAARARLERDFDGLRDDPRFLALIGEGQAAE
jgi:non-specific serine/threonine protein kinase